MEAMIEFECLWPKTNQKTYLWFLFVETTFPATPSTHKLCLFTVTQVASLLRHRSQGRSIKINGFLTILSFRFFSAFSSSGKCEGRKQ